MTPIFSALLALAGPLVCPMTGEPIPDGAKAYDWNGLRFRMCCAGCVESFKRDPGKALAAAGKQSWVVATSVFDPISGRKLTPQMAQGGVTDYGGVRFAFQSAGNKAIFDADPKRYGAIPAKACGICPVMGVSLSNTYMATGFADVDGVRYFSCCDQCFPKLRSQAGTFAKEWADKAGEPKVYEVPAVWQKMTGPGG